MNMKNNGIVNLDNEVLDPAEEEWDGEGMPDVGNEAFPQESEWDMGDNRYCDWDDEECEACT